MNITRLLFLGGAILLCCLAFAVAEESATEETNPDMVTIGALSYWFSEVDFPHELHADIVGDCESCHHNSDGEAIECAACHEETYDVRSPELPALNVAYHLNCVTCHEEAGAPTGCEDCHARAALPPGPVMEP